MSKYVILRRNKSQGNYEAFDKEAIQIASKIEDVFDSYNDYEGYILLELRNSSRKTEKFFNRTFKNYWASKAGRFFCP